MNNHFPSVAGFAIFVMISNLFQLSPPKLNAASFSSKRNSLYHLIRKRSTFTSPDSISPFRFNDGEILGITNPEEPPVGTHIQSLNSYLANLVSKTLSTSDNTERNEQLYKIYGGGTTFRTLDTEKISHYLDVNDTTGDLFIKRVIDRDNLCIEKQLCCDDERSTGTISSKDETRDNSCSINFSIRAFINSTRQNMQIRAQLIVLGIFHFTVFLFFKVYFLFFKSFNHLKFYYLLVISYEF